MWLYLLAAPGAEVVSPALSTLEKGVLGSLLIISWALATLAIVQLIRVQNARVSDQKEMNKKSEDLMSKMVVAFEGMKGALVGLKDAEEKGQKVTEAVHAAMTSMSSRLDMLVFTMGGKRFTPHSMSKPPSPREPER